jgi:type IV pilus assembly protein PilB
LKAAQTGHLVLSTLHTNDSFSAVTRLLDLGIPGFMIASSVSAILAQRLVRRLCDCRKQIPVSSEAKRLLTSLGMVEPLDTIYGPGGCSDCDQTGYRGRVGVYEILIFTEAVREGIRGGQTPEDLRGALCGMGMRLMQEDALDKIQQGITSLDEVTRVVPVQRVDHSLICSECDHKIPRTVRFCSFCGAKQEGDKLPTGRKGTRRAIEEALKL